MNRKVDRCILLIHGKANKAMKTITLAIRSTLDSDILFIAAIA